MDVDGDTVHVTFEDGTTNSGNMIIGCDGARSRVREFLVGREAAQLEYVDLTMINFPRGGYTANEARLLQTMHPVFKIAAHPAGIGNSILAGKDSKPPFSVLDARVLLMHIDFVALDIANPEDPTTWVFQNYIGWWGPPYAKDLQDPKARMDFYRSFASEFCEPFRTALLKPTDGDVAVPIFPGNQWAPTMPWDNYGGKVTLAGDAAHSMVPRKCIALYFIRSKLGCSLQRLTAPTQNAVRVLTTLLRMPQILLKRSRRRCPERRRSAKQ